MKIEKYLKDYLDEEDIEKIKNLVESKKLYSKDSIDLYYNCIERIYAGISFKTIYKDIKKDRIDFLSTDSRYQQYINERELKDQQLENPPVMKDGIAPCPKCKEKKTVIIEFQGRSCDEGFTYELHCYNKKCNLTKTRNFEML